MPRPDFAVAIIGNDTDPCRAELRSQLTARTATLSDSSETVEIVSQGDLSSLAQAGRTAAVVLCRGKSVPQLQSDAIARCQELEVPIFPVLEDLTRFAVLVPEALSPYNGFELRCDEDIGELVGLVLEALGLERAKRKIFISYVRMDSARIAEQLRGAFTRRWYTVFHDTVSIRPGRDFQDELLQELADSDVMLLLNSKHVGERKYVKKEIEFANVAGVGGVQVVWPDADPRPDAGFFTRVDLKEQSRLQGDCLSDEGVAAVLRAVADARTALQDFREDQLAKPIVAYAHERSWKAVRHLGRFVALHAPDCKRRVHLPFALGLPTSVDFQRTWMFANAQNSAANLVYDPLGLTKRQLEHMEFLGERLPLNLLDYKAPKTWRVIP
jgi:hypothetical protein